MDDPSLNGSELLRQYLSARDETAASATLSDLIGGQVESVARNVMRRKVGASFQEWDERTINQDAMDLVSQTKATVLAKLIEMRSSRDTADIQNFDGYVRAVAANAANHYLRQKYPKRTSLKNQLRYLLTHDPGLAVWKSGNEWLCGLTETLGADRAAQVPDDIDKTLELKGIAAEKVQLRKLLWAILKAIGEPVRFDDAVAAVYQLRKIEEPSETAAFSTLSEIGTEEPGAVVQFEQRELMQKMWEEIGELPLRHRAAVLLNLRNSSGEGVVTLFPLLRIASVRQIAEILEFRPEEFAGIWNELPWDDQRIAERLGLTRQQVINLRHSARARLRRKLNNFC